MKACLETTSMFCSREILIGLKIIQQNEKSTQILKVDELQCEFEEINMCVKHFPL